MSLGGSLTDNTLSIAGPRGLDLQRISREWPEMGEAQRRRLVAPGEIGELEEEPTSERVLRGDPEWLALMEPLPSAVPVSFAPPEPPGRHAQRPLRRPAQPVGASSVWGGLRLRVGPAQVAVVVLLVAGGLLAGAWWTFRATPQEVTLVGDLSAPPSGPASGAAAGASPGTPSGPLGAAPAGGGGLPTSAAGASGSSAAGAAPAGQVVVDVSGEVRRPGIAVLPAGSRVIDALKAAGGARRGVDLTELNLARPLVEQDLNLTLLQPVDWGGGWSYAVVDSVRYRPAAGWPQLAGGATGLTRSELSGFGSEPAFWQAAALQPGDAAQTPAADIQVCSFDVFVNANRQVEVRWATSPAGAADAFRLLRSPLDDPSQVEIVTGDAAATSDPAATPGLFARVDPTADPHNCGGCGTTCPVPANATATCSGSTCGLSCNSGYGNCDNQAGNGCEVNLNTSAANCGACGSACRLANARRLAPRRFSPRAGKISARWRR